MISSYPIGYDTIDYATQILDWKHILKDPNTFFQAPFFILQADFIYVLTSVDPLVILRFFQPLLFGFLISSFYYASRTVYSRASKWAFLGSIVFSLQTVTLRISWDLLKNELSLAFLLLMLSHLKRPKSFVFILLTILIGVSHQIISFILLAIIMGLLLKYSWYRQHNEAKHLFLSSIPFFIIIATVIFYNVNLINFEKISTDGTVFYPTIFSIPIEQSLPFPFVNYLVGEGLADYQGSYLSLAIDVLTLFIASFLPLLPFLIVRLNRIRKKALKITTTPIDIWMVVCSIPVINCLLTPRTAFFSWHRWLLMLVVPFTFYAINQLIFILSKIKSHKIRLFLPYMILGILGLSSIFYLITPYTSPVSLYAALNPSSKYSPTTMMRNSISQIDVPSLERAFPWLSQKIDRESCLLVKDAFLDWSKLLIATNHTIINYRNQDVKTGVRYAQLLNYTKIYWIWWDNGIGIHWYGQEIPDFFIPIYQVNTIVIYKYIP